MRLAILQEAKLAVNHDKNRAIKKSALDLTLIINQLERCLSNKEKATLLNTTHGLGYESPSEFNKVVLSFIDKH